MCTRRGETLMHACEDYGAGKLLWRGYWTPWGEGLVGADQLGLRAVELPRTGGEDQAAVRTWGACAQSPTIDPRVGRLLDHWVASLEEYFRGDRCGWGADDIPWESLRLSVFARAVYEALLHVPCGATVSYGGLAEMAGYPGAARAVGSAMAANPIPVVIPCHRVIRADGSLGNYGDDPSWKPRLLNHERALVAGRREQ
jgi:methylated-DNA-[protein]-cysteine S-methyltransferase